MTSSKSKPITAPQLPADIVEMPPNEQAGQSDARQATSPKQRATPEPATAPTSPISQTSGHVKLVYSASTGGKDAIESQEMELNGVYPSIVFARQSGLEQSYGPVAYHDDVGDQPGSGEGKGGRTGVPSEAGGNMLSYAALVEPLAATESRETHNDGPAIVPARISKDCGLYIEDWEICRPLDAKEPQWGLLFDRLKDVSDEVRSVVSQLAEHGPKIWAGVRGEGLPRGGGMSIDPTWFGWVRTLAHDVDKLLTVKPAIGDWTEGKELLKELGWLAADSMYAACRFEGSDTNEPLVYLHDQHSRKPYNRIARPRPVQKKKPAVAESPMYLEDRHMLRPYKQIYKPLPAVRKYQPEELKRSDEGWCGPSEGSCMSTSLPWSGLVSKQL